MRYTPEEASKLEVFFAVNGGFQRLPNPKKVEECKNYLLKPWCIQPPLMVARITDRNYIETVVDGNHRRLAAIKAEMSVSAIVVDMTWAEVKKNFAHHNRNITRVSPKVTILSSDNPVAKSVRALARDYTCSLDQMRALYKGLFYGRRNKSLDVINDDVDVTDVEKRAKRILSVWSKHKYWEHAVRFDATTSGEVYRASGTIKALGIAFRKVALSDLKNYVRAVRDNTCWTKSGKFHKHYSGSSKHIRQMSQDMIATAINNN